MNDAVFASKKIRSDLRALTEDIEEAMKVKADGAYERAAAFQPRVERILEPVKSVWSSGREILDQETKRVARATVSYSRQHPWNVAGAAVGAAVIASLLVGLRQIRDVDR